MRRDEGFGTRALDAIVTATAAVAIVLSVWSPPARAEFDWPVTLSLPDGDWAVGVSGGVAFGEELRARTTGWLAGLDVSFLEGLFGVHAGIRVHREGYSYRLSGYAEVTIWYLLMIGVGVHGGGMLGDGGPDIENESLALGGFFGIPIPLYRFGDDGSDGTMVLMPYARPGMRFVSDGVQGCHEVGLSLRWTSFGF